MGPWRRHSQNKLSVYGCVGYPLLSMTPLCPVTVPPHGAAEKEQYAIMVSLKFNQHIEKLFGAK